MVNVKGEEHAGVQEFRSSGEEGMERWGLVEEWGDEGGNGGAIEDWSGGGVE